jgi:hypothetical protein
VKNLIRKIALPCVVSFFLISLLFARDSEKFLFNFPGGNYGQYPYGLADDANGHIYGVLWGGGTTYGGVVYKLSPNANGVMTENILHTFSGGDDGRAPTNILMDGGGNLYVSVQFGAVTSCLQGCGAIVGLSPLANGSWSTKVLYQFPGGFAGEHPYLSLIDAQGNLYGNTENGQIWELTKTPGGVWKRKVLVRTNDNLALPRAIDGAGNIYGTSASLVGCFDGCGYVFELSRSSDGAYTETVIYSFTGGSDGAEPVTVLLDANGNLFGAAGYGGSTAECTQGCGTLFELTPSSSGYSESTLHTFNKLLDGEYPSCLQMDASGNLYVSLYGGGVAGGGVVLEFSLASNGIWQYSTLYSFSGGKGGGDTYQIILDSSGNVYGTSLFNGSTGNGMIYELSPL